MQISNEEDPSLACPEKVDKANSICWSSFSIHCTGQHHYPCEIGYFVCSACVDMVGFVASLMLYYEITKIILKIAVDHVHPSWTHQVYPRPVLKKFDYNPTTLVSGAGLILLSIDLPFADS